MKEMQNRFEKHNGLRGQGNRFRDQHVDLSPLPEKSVLSACDNIVSLHSSSKRPVGNFSIFENFQVLFSRFNDSYSIH